MTGVEIDMIVKSCLEALPLYETIFPVERIEVTALPVGQNEAVFGIFGTRLHMLDENPEYGMFAPKPGDPLPIWFNVVVEDIGETYRRAMDAGCTEVQPVTEVPGFGAFNAMFTDPFGYLWMLHQIVREVSFEERLALMTQIPETDTDA